MLQPLRQAADPVITGRRVMAALDAGRRVAIERAQGRASLLERSVRQLLDLDIIAGKPARGRAGRIARALRGRVTERHVKRILDSLSSVSDSQASNRHHESTRDHIGALRD